MSPSETQTTYNGILHYETVAVASRIKDAPASSAYWSKVAEEVYGQCQEKGDPVIKLAELLERQHHLAMAPVTCGLYADLLNAALRRVRWRDVAIELLATVDA